MQMFLEKKIQKNVYGHLVSACFIIVHLIFTLRGYSVKNLYYTGVYSHRAKNETLLDDFLCEMKWNAQLHFMGVSLRYLSKFRDLLLFEAFENSH